MQPLTVCVVSVAALATGALVWIYAGLCRLLPKQHLPAAATDDHDAYLTMVAIAHDDIWWAKEHAWTIVAAALAILVAVLLVDFSSKPPYFKDLLSSTILVVIVGSNWYVGRMQADMAGARIRSAYLIRRCDPLTRVVGEVVEGDLTDYNRGSGFMAALLVLTSLIGGGALWVLRDSSREALLAYCVLLTLGLAGLFLQVRRRATREKALDGRAA